jgi:hypothetical protein
LTIRRNCNMMKTDSAGNLLHSLVLLNAHPYTKAHS